MANEGNIALKSESTSAEWITKSLALNKRLSESVRGVASAVQLVTEEAEGELVDRFSEISHGVIVWTDTVDEGMFTVVDSVRRMLEVIRRILGMEDDSLPDFPYVRPPIINYFLGCKISTFLSHE